MSRDITYRKTVAVVASSLTTKSTKKRGVPTTVHERELRFKLACGHETVRRFPIGRPTTEVGHKLRCEHCTAADKGEAAA